MIDLYLMAAIYILAGLNHFIHPAFYYPMMPPWIPFHRFGVAASGVLEILLGVLLLVPHMRVVAAWGVCLLLILFLPIHVYMIQERHLKFKKIPSWFLYLRLPLQFALILWAYHYV